MQFEDVFAVFGVLLMTGAFIAGLARRTFLSLTALFVVAGFVLGRGGLKVLEFDAGSGFVEILAVVALILILFRDGLEVEAEMLRQAWRPPLRKLVLAMPLTCVLVACVTKALTGLTWTESFLVGALLSPTDPVLSSSVVTNPRVPRMIRHSLNLESGLNDGLALPAVLAFAYALDPSKSNFVWWRFVLQDVTLGFTVGIAVGFVASLLLVGKSLTWEITPHNKAMYAIGVAFGTYALAHAVNGNGLIAVFVCAITLGIRRPDIRESFESRSEDVIEIVKLGIFVVFGSLLTLHGLFQDGWAAVAIVAFTLVLARPVTVLVALVGTRTDLATRLFMGWFGPKGVATMTFSLLVLNEGIADGREIFNIAALAVFASILAHGLTDTPGANAIARHAEHAAA
jgi:NhaP-type Na+/H+ or K+/H+ antiporter